MGVARYLWLGLSIHEGADDGHQRPQSLHQLVRARELGGGMSIWEPAWSPVRRLSRHLHVVGRVPLSSIGSRSAAEMVSAVDAMHRAQEMSDEQCDGVADDVQIQTAIGGLP